MLDLVIRNGLIVDGSGLPGRHGDVSIHAGKVVAVGGRAGEAQRVLDATGRVIAPGFRLSCRCMCTVAADLCVCCCPRSN